MENTQLKRHRYSWSSAEDLLLTETFENTPKSHRSFQIKHLAKKIGRTESAVKQRYELYFSKKAKKSIKRLETIVENEVLDTNAPTNIKEVIQKKIKIVEEVQNDASEIESTRVEIVKALFSELSLREKIKIILSAF
jgi:hypothetical protein